MGISLSYVTIETISPDVQVAVKTDAQRINNEHRWWCEPLSFFDWPGHEGKLAGATKLFLPGYGPVDGKYIEVDPADDCFMAARDAAFIMNQLVRWSAEHEISWHLGIEGQDIGVIEKGEIDPQLMAMISELPMLGCEDPNVAIMDIPDIDDDEHARIIDEKYASRWD